MLLVLRRDCRSRRFLLCGSATGTSPCGRWPFRGPSRFLSCLPAVDPESLFKAEREHRALVERAQDVLLFARRLGLVGQDGDQFSLTEVGAEYQAAEDEEDIWEVSARQAAILRDQLLELYRSVGVLGGAALMLSILATGSSERTYSNEDLGRALVEPRIARAGAVSRRSFRRGPAS